MLDEALKLPKPQRVVGRDYTGWINDQIFHVGNSGSSLFGPARRGSDSMATRTSLDASFAKPQAYFISLRRCHRYFRFASHHELLDRSLPFSS